VLGKGRRPRACPFGDKTAMALERYLRERRKRGTVGDALWIGIKGPMTGSGIRQMVWRRSEAAGIGRIYPHQLRHSFAHSWLAAGGNEQDLMRLVGWRVAHDAHEVCRVDGGTTRARCPPRLSPDDRL
jgi:site-specific recombinase XerD